MSARRTWGLAAVLGLCASCPFLGSELEGFEGAPSSDSDRIPVVDDAGPFDPSEAVDDDDGVDVLADKDDPTDSSAFREADAEGTPPAATESAENEKGDGDLGEGKEDVAAPAEVEALKEQKERAVEHADDGPVDEDERKAELGRNPPPEGTVESERSGTKLVDFLFETLVVALLSALIAAGLVYARSHTKTVAVASLVAVLIAAFVVIQRA